MNDDTQLSFDFERSARARNQSVREAKPVTTVLSFRDALSIKVRQQAIQRVTASGIFSVEDLKEG